MLSAAQAVFVLAVPAAAGVAVGAVGGLRAARGAGRWAPAAGAIAAGAVCAGALWSVYGAPALRVLPSSNMLFVCAAGAGLLFAVTGIIRLPRWAAWTVRVLACACAAWLVTRWKVQRGQWGGWEHAAMSAALGAGSAAFAALCGAAAGWRPTHAHRAATRGLVLGAVAGPGAGVLVVGASAATLGMISGAIALLLTAAALAEAAMRRLTRRARGATGESARPSATEAAAVVAALMLTMLWVDGHLSAYLEWWHAAALAASPALGAAAGLIPARGWKGCTLRVLATGAGASAVLTAALLRADLSAY